MHRITVLLLALCLGGCATARVNTSTATRQQAYLAELPQQRERQWGPCECTYHFLNDVGAAGVPTVIQALDTFSGPTNSLMRALIVDGAQYYSHGTNTVVAPIMTRAAHDPAAEVQAVGNAWFDKQRKKQ